jgi:pyridoxamine 5'-phosphate oxidase
MMTNISDIRTDYTKYSIDELGLNANPIEQFKTWFNHAQKAKVNEVNAMVLSTATVTGIPSGRVLLLKGVEDNGFTFFTNYTSSKGNELEANPFASMTFFWSELEQQIRISGKVTKIDVEQSEKYFNSRPRGSQISAAASNQSAKVEHREVLTNEVRRLEQLYEGKEIPKPENWGGYILEPAKVEFWQGRASRLHDRFLYELIDGSWQISRLAP